MNRQATKYLHNIGHGAWVLVHGNELVYWNDQMRKRKFYFTELIKNKNGPIIFSIGLNQYIICCWFPFVFESRARITELHGTISPFVIDVDRNVYLICEGVVLRNFNIGPEPICDRDCLAENGPHKYFYKNRVIIDGYGKYSFMSISRVRYNRTSQNIEITYPMQWEKVVQLFAAGPIDIAYKGEFIPTSAEFIYGLVVQYGDKMGMDMIRLYDSCGQTVF